MPLHRHCDIIAVDAMLMEFGRLPHLRIFCNFHFFSGQWYPQPRVCKNHGKTWKVHAHVIQNMFPHFGYHKWLSWNIHQRLPHIRQINHHLLFPSPFICFDTTENLLHGDHYSLFGQADPQQDKVFQVNTDEF